MVKVILDSNFFLIPSKYRIDIFESIESLLNRRIDFIVLGSVYAELLRMAEKSPPKTRRNVMLALKFADKCRVVHVEKRVGEQNDDLIVRVAATWRCPVATNDGALKRKLRDISLPVIYLRQESHLAMEGSI